MLIDDLALKIQANDLGGILDKKVVMNALVVIVEKILHDFWHRQFVNAIQVTGVGVFWNVAVWFE